MMRIFARCFHGNDDPWNGAPPWAVELREMMGLVLKQDRRLETSDMATKEHLDALTAQVKANTDATAAAQAALTGYVATVSDLTAKLQAAIASDDDDAVKAAADAIAANNAVLTAATPAVAAAVTAGTPAAPAA